MTIQLHNKTHNSLIGTISETDLQYLVDQLEEESSSDTEYFIDQTTIDILEASGASASLLSLLRQAVGDSDGIDIQWIKA